MKYKIGFHGYEEEKKGNLQPLEIGENKPVKSVVQVRFPSQGRSFAYYNDRFDLHVGDIVFVEGKLEGVQGTVTEVSRSFKIKLSDYKRVISVADTTVKGELFFGGSHLIAFDKSVISYEKVRGWFLPPESDEEVAVGYDDEATRDSSLMNSEISKSNPRSQNGALITTTTTRWCTSALTEQPAGRSSRAAGFMR